jgi:hypothetical protein
VAKILGSQEGGKQLTPNQRAALAAEQNKLEDLARIQRDEVLLKYVETTPATEVQTRIAELEASGDKPGADRLRQIFTDCRAALQKQETVRGNQVIADFPWDEYNKLPYGQEQRNFAEKYLVKNSVSPELQKTFLENLNQETNKEHVAELINRGIYSDEMFDMQKLLAMGVRPQDLPYYIEKLKAMNSYDPGDAGKEGVGLIKNFQDQIKNLASILDKGHPQDMRWKINNLLAAELRARGIAFDDPRADPVIREQLDALSEDKDLSQFINQYHYDPESRKYRSLEEIKEAREEDEITRQLRHRDFNDSNRFNRALMRQALRTGQDIDSIIRQRTNELPLEWRGLAKSRGLPLLMMARLMLSDDPKFANLPPGAQVLALTQIMDQIEEHQDYSSRRTGNGDRPQDSLSRYITF